MLGWGVLLGMIDVRQELATLFRSTGGHVQEKIIENCHPSQSRETANFEAKKSSAVRSHRLGHWQVARRAPMLWLCQAFEEKLPTYLGNVDELCGLLKKFRPKDQFQSQDNFTCDSGAREKRLSKSNRYAWRPWAASCVQMLFACTQSWTTSTLWQLMRQRLWLALFLCHVRDRFAFGRGDLNILTPAGKWRGCPIAGPGPVHHGSLRTRWQWEARGLPNLQ